MGGVKPCVFGFRLRRAMSIRRVKQRDFAAAIGRSESTVKKGAAGIKSPQKLKEAVENQPTIEAEPVTHCKDCIYFKPEHVKCPDGTAKDYSEFPAEAFEPNLNLGVTAAYGINVGSQCIYDEWCGAYSDDKTVFRRADDYCSRGKRKTEVNKNAGSIHAE